MTLALFIPGQPWRIRWRLFILRDVARCVITIVRWFRATPKPLPLRIHIPSRDAGRMILVHAYVPYTTERKIDYPVHVNLYGGAFFGGNGRDDDFFCARIARDVGAVVLCPNYRLAPEHIFPAGLEVYVPLF
jgi:acetyl esterase/lipase